MVISATQHFKLGPINLVVLVMVFFLSMSRGKIKYDRYVTKLVLMFGFFF